MMDAAPHEQEQYQEEDDLLEMEEKRIVVVCLPWLHIKALSLVII